MTQKQKTGDKPAISSEDVIASDVTKSNVGNNGASPKPSIAELYKLGKLRINQSHLDGATAAKRPTSVPVGRPSSQAFVQVHPGEEYRDEVTLLALKDDREIYLVHPDLLEDIDADETYQAMIFTYITRAGTTGLWPIRLPGPDGRINEWHSAAMSAAQAAMLGWVRIKPNQESRGYVLIPGKGDAVPRWPMESFPELLDIAFRRFYIDTFDHLALKRLRDEN
jgi:hypothetical protein